MLSRATNMVWQDYLEILLRRRWYVMVPFVLSVSISAVLCFTLPKTYKSSTLILVEQQKVPEAYVKSSVSTNIDERLGTIKEQIMSRSLLQSVIDEFGLYKDHAGQMAPEELLEKMRRHVEIKVEKGRGNIDAFNISYEGKNPNTVMLVTNKLASLFIEENLKAREEFVEGTSDFLDTELNGIKAELEEQENKIRQFKQHYMGELPEQVTANLRTLDRLQLEQQAVGESLSKAKERRAVFLEKDSKPPPILDRATIEAMKDMNPAQFRLAQLRIELADLQTRFTDKYPDVVRLKNEIADLETKLKASDSERMEPRSGRTKEGGPKKETAAADAALANDTRGTYRQTDIEILRLEEKQKQITEQMKAYESRVENAPLREQQMLTLMRDYENTKQHYQSLLDKKLNARISQNLEKRQKGEQFRVLDPANMPERPSSPDRFKIILLGLIAGLSAGGGAAYLREMTDVTFRKAEEVETALHLTVLATIPKISESVKKREGKTA